MLPKPSPTANIEQARGRASADVDGLGSVKVMPRLVEPTAQGGRGAYSVALRTDEGGSEQVTEGKE